MAEQIDPRERKLLGDILALVVSDQPGQSASALEALCRRARQDQVTGGAIKRLFDSLSDGAPRRADAAPPDPAEVNRSDRTLGHLERQLAYTRAELGRERKLGDSLAGALRRARLLSWIGAPVLGAAGLAAGLLLGGIGRAKPPQLSVSPATTALPETVPPPTAGALPPPADVAVLPEEVRGAITDHLRRCRLAPPDGVGGAKQAIRVQLEVGDGGAILAARVLAADPAQAANPAFQALADRVRQALLAPGCAALPLPAYLLGRVKTIGFRFTP